MFSGIFCGLVVAWILDFLFVLSFKFTILAKELLNVDISQSTYYVIFMIMGMISWLFGKVV